jgi:hypothetical protein
MKRFIVIAVLLAAISCGSDKSAPAPVAAAPTVATPTPVPVSPKPTEPGSGGAAVGY